MRVEAIIITENNDIKPAKQKSFKEHEINALYNIDGKRMYIKAKGNHKGNKFKQLLKELSYVEEKQIRKENGYNV